MTLHYVIRDVIKKETCLKMVPNCNAFVTLLGPDTKKLFKFLQSKPKPFLEPNPHPIQDQPLLDQLKIGPIPNRTNPNWTNPKLDQPQIGPTPNSTNPIPTNSIWTKPNLDLLDQIETNLKSGPTQNRDKPKEPKPNLAIYFMCYQVQLFRVQEF